MAKLAIDRASIVFGEKSGDCHSKSGDREIFIILSKIGRSPEKTGDLEALQHVTSFSHMRSALVGKRTKATGFHKQNMWNVCANTLEYWSKYTKSDCEVR